MDMEIHKRVSSMMHALQGNIEYRAYTTHKPMTAFMTPTYMMFVFNALMVYQHYLPPTDYFTASTSWRAALKIAQGKFGDPR